MDPLTLGLVSGGLSLADNMFDFSGAQGREEDMIKLQKEQLAMAKAQQARHDRIFGSTEVNLKAYYDSLDPNSIKAQRTQELQKQYQISQDTLKKNLAKLGMEDSGLMAQAQIQGTHQLATDKAQASYSAEQDVAEQRANFLNLGMGHQAQITSNISRAQENLQGGYASLANSAYVRQQNLYSDLGQIANIYGKQQAFNDYSGYTQDQKDAFKIIYSK
jgi:hypothetical protein